MIDLFKSFRRRRTLAKPWPAVWESILCQNVAHFGLITEAERESLRELVKVLVAEKVWEGCRGLTVTDEMKVTIAAQAGLLLLGMAHDYFSRLMTILIYPSTFETNLDDDYNVVDKGFPACGQAIYHGPVILAWDTVLAEGRDLTTGRNVVIHEFAHHLDFLDGMVNGTPQLKDDEACDRWREVMVKEFKQLQLDLNEGAETILHEQAGWNETEFFSLASEAFFVQPVLLRDRHPTLYDLLATYYNISTIKWHSTNDLNPNQLQ